MFFILSKIIAFLTVPFTWIIGYVLWGVFAKKKHNKQVAFITAAFLTLLFTNSIIFDEFMRVWEFDGKTKEEVAHHDVGIVLGGMVAYNMDLERISFRRGSDRLWKAVELYKMGKLDKLLLSGDSGSLIEDGLNEAQQLKAYLVQLGIPAEDILTETRSRNTHENAIETAKTLKNHPEFDSYLLITSGYHMRRAKACFDKVGLKVDTYSTDLYTGKRYLTFERLFIPNIEVMKNWNLLSHEITGYVVYKLMGYI